MAFTYGFYNSKGGDRKYNADQMGNLFDGILNDGVFDNVGNIFATVPGEGLQVLVKSGRAWFNKTWSYNDAAYPIYLERPDVAVPRIDAIVLEVDRRETHRRNRIGYISGIPDSTPKKPTLTNTDLIHQHPLAYVTVRAGTESILHSDIEIRVGQSDCPFVTGILKTASIDDLFAAWNEQFTTWFEGVRSQLEGDVAANLLREIQLRLPIADKATSSEVGAGTVDNKYITPKQLAPHLGKIKDSVTGQVVSVSLKDGYFRIYNSMHFTDDELDNHSGYSTNAIGSFSYDDNLATIVWKDGNIWRLYYMQGANIKVETFNTKQSSVDDGSIDGLRYIYRTFDKSPTKGIVAVYMRNDTRGYYLFDLFNMSVSYSSISAITKNYVISELKQNTIRILSRSGLNTGSASYPITMPTTPIVMGGRENTLIVAVNDTTMIYFHELNITGLNSVTANANRLTLPINSNHRVSSWYPQIGNFAFITVANTSTSPNKYLACPICINCNTYSNNYSSQAASSELVDDPPSIHVGGNKVVVTSKKGAATICYIIDFNNTSPTMTEKLTNLSFSGVNSINDRYPTSITSLRINGTNDAAFLNTNNNSLYILTYNNTFYSIPCFLSDETYSNSRYIQFIKSAYSVGASQYTCGRVVSYVLSNNGANTDPLLIASDEQSNPVKAFSAGVEKIVTG